MVIWVLLNEAWMCASPWCTMRFSPRFLNVLRGAFFPPSVFFSAASVFALSLSDGPAHAAAVLYGLLLGDGALARPLARARVGARPLTPHRQVAAVPQPAIAADFHQPLDIHRDLFAQVA